jgi:hypothetical protein
MSKILNEFVLKITKDERDNVIRIVIASPSTGLFNICYIGLHEHERYISVNYSALPDGVSALTDC